MALERIVNVILEADRRLQAGANNLAHKANEYVGLGNYQISSLFFGAAAALEAARLGIDVYTAVTIPDNSVNPFLLFYGALGIYQIVRNRRLEKRESQIAKESDDAIAVDFNLSREKRSFINLGIFAYTQAKHVYAIWALLDIMALQYGMALHLAFDASLLLGQYFREVDHIKPTKKNKVFDFLGNLVPKRIAVPSPSPS